MNMSYQDLLRMRERNALRGGMRLHLEQIYALVHKHIQSSLNLEILELGAGSGLSRFFLPNLNVLRTDFMNWDQPHVIGGIDAQKLPYKDSSFSAVFGIDVLHHIQRPLEFLEEALRVLHSGGKIVLIEPFVSFLSYPIYKIFHEERTSWKLPIDSSIDLVLEDPEDGNQGVSRAFFYDVEGLALLSEHLGRSIRINTTFLMPFSFFATGGVTNPIGTPRLIIKILQWIEDKIPYWILPHISSRILIVIAKN